MITKFVGMREFRDNLAMFTKKSKKGVRYIVLRKNVPVLEVRPISGKQFALEKLHAELDQAEAQYKKGKFYTDEQIHQQFGLS